MGNKKTALVIGSLTLMLPAGAFAADPQHEQQQQQYQQQQQQGANVSPSTDRDIRQGLGTVFEAALDGDMSDIVDNLEKGDRERLANANQNDLPLDKNAIQRFQDKWDAQFSDKKITEAQIPYMVSSAREDASRAGARARMGTEGSVLRNEAMVVVPAAKGQETQVKLVDEGTLTSAWRIDIPDSVSGQQIQQSLNTAFNQLNSQTLPNDEKKAASIVAGHIFRALTGQGARS